MNPVISPVPIGRAGQGKNEQQGPAPSGGGAAPSGMPARAAPVATYAMGAEETYMLRLAELAELGRTATRVGEAASALQLARAAVDDVPEELGRLRATAGQATGADDDEQRAIINESFVDLRDRVIAAGQGASFRGAPLFADAEHTGQVPLGGMDGVRRQLEGLDVLDAERLPQVMGVIEEAARTAEREHQALRGASAEVDAAAGSLGDAASDARDVTNMETRAKQVARAMLDDPAQALGALRNPRAVALALLGQRGAENPA